MQILAVQLNDLVSREFCSMFPA